MSKLKVDLESYENQDNDDSVEAAIEDGASVYVENGFKIGTKYKTIVPIKEQEDEWDGEFF